MKLTNVESDIIRKITRLLSPMRFYIIKGSLIYPTEHIGANESLFDYTVEDALDILSDSLNIDGSDYFYNVKAESDDYCTSYIIEEVTTESSVTIKAGKSKILGREVIEIHETDVDYTTVSILNCLDFKEGPFIKLFNLKLLAEYYALLVLEDITDSLHFQIDIRKISNDEIKTGVLKHSEVKEYYGHQYEDLVKFRDNFIYPIFDNYRKRDKNLIHNHIWIDEQQQWCYTGTFKPFELRDVPFILSITGQTVCLDSALNYLGYLDRSLSRTSVYEIDTDFEFSSLYFNYYPQAIEIEKYPRVSYIKIKDVMVTNKLRTLRDFILYYDFIKTVPDLVNFIDICIKQEEYKKSEWLDIMENKQLKQIWNKVLRDRKIKSFRI